MRVDQLRTFTNATFIAARSIAGQTCRGATSPLAFLRPAGVAIGRARGMEDAPRGRSAALRGAELRIPLATQPEQN